MIKAKKNESNRILYIQYTNPANYPPLEHSSRILAREGWGVIFLGVGALGSSDNLKFTPHPNITVKQIPFAAPGWQQKLHYLWFFLWTISWIFRWQPQIVYASDLLSCPIALLISFLPSVRVIYHEHDSPLSLPNLFIQICLSARKSLSHRTLACILPNQQRLENFIQTTAKESKAPMFCVWNCPNQEEVAEAKLSKTDENFWLLYHGSIVPPQLPETILQAMAMLPDNIKLRIIGYETSAHIGYVQHLKELAIKLDIPERIEYLGTVPSRTDLLQQCQKCDVGLSLFPVHSIQPMPGASNKPFDYLACGLALLVSDIPDWSELYVKPGYALACNPEEPESIAKALLWYLEHPSQMRKMGEEGRQRIFNEWNYENQFSVVKDQLDKIQ